MRILKKFGLPYFIVENEITHYCTIKCRILFSSMWQALHYRANSDCAIKCDRNKYFISIE